MDQKVTNKSQSGGGAPVPAPFPVCPFAFDIVQRGDALELLRSLPVMYEAYHQRIRAHLLVVDLIAWDNMQPGNGKRSRRCGDYVIMLQKKPVRAGATWRNHGIRSRWSEKVDRKLHPHIKPIGLIKRLIAATTDPGDIICDPAAGSFVVMHAAHKLERQFLGCDIAFDGGVS